MAFTASDPDAIVPPSAGAPGAEGDVCPQLWVVDFDRAQMSTQVLIGRAPPGVIPDLPYNYPGSEGPTTGELVLNNADQSLATRMYVDKTDRDGVDVSIWLRYLAADSSVRLTQASAKGVSRGYRIMSAPIEHPLYFELPIGWEDGGEPVPAGVVTLSLSPLAEPPDLYVDAFGRDTYGPMTYARTDLINSSRDLFETLADRILEIRGSNSVPRIASVTIDARTSRTFPIKNMTLMSTCAPERPSRYRMRLRSKGGRQIFDRMCFATSVRHFISDNEWTLTVGLDVAEWAAQL